MDQLLRQLVDARNDLVVPLAAVAHVMVKSTTWFLFGYARGEDFARERLRRSGRWLRDLAALHEVLERHAAVAAALRGRDGGPPLGRVAALLVGRIASDNDVRDWDVQDWIAWARRHTVQELRAEIARVRARRADSTVVDAPENETSADACAADPSESQALDDSRAADPPERQASDAACASQPTVVQDAVECAEDSVQVRFSMPPSIYVAFDEVLDLHRAVTGRQTSPGAFVEALAAEASTVEVRSEVPLTPIQHGPSQLERERTVAHASSRWRILREAPESIPPVAASPGIQRALHLLAEFQQLLEETRDCARGDHRSDGEFAGRHRPDELLAACERFVDLEDQIDICIGDLLSEMTERRAWRALQFDSAGHYAEERLGMSRSQARDRVALARGLHKFTLLREAYESRRIGVEATLLVLRVLRRGRADRQTEKAWVEHASGMTVKRLRVEVRVVERKTLLARRQPPEKPPDARPLSDTEWLEALQRWPGQARERVVGLACDVLHDTISRAPVTDVVLRLRLHRETAEAFTASLESARRHVQVVIESAEASSAGDNARLRPSARIAQTFSARGQRVPPWVGLVALLEEYVCTWDDPKGHPRRASDAVYMRAGCSCTAPGCTSMRELEDHHLEPRSQGGSNALHNRTCGCRFHHQHGAHGVLASCRGRAPDGIVWRLGLPELGEYFMNERRIASPAQIEMPTETEMPAQIEMLTQIGMPTQTEPEPAEIPTQTEMQAPTGMPASSEPQVPSEDPVPAEPPTLVSV